MKRIYSVLILCSLVIGAYAQVRIDISVVQADSLIRANTGNTDFGILDVRTSGEYAGGHIQSAININYYSANFRSNLDTLDKDDIYLVYCKSGSRSTKAVDTMLVLGFQKVFNMLGGIDTWKNAGFNVVTNRTSPDVPSLKVNLYPNPAADFITIDIKGLILDDVVFNIYNYLGSRLKTGHLKQIQNRVYIGDLSNGMYILEIKSRDRRIRQKLIIRR
jgi:rhodanese-related sulfurtransferase